MYRQFVRLEDGVYYVVYVGEVKACCLNAYVAQAFRRSIGQEVRVISIVPDMMMEYRWTDVMVVNPPAERLRWVLGRDVARRVPSAAFAAGVCADAAVLRLLTELVRRQGEVPVWMFESRPELSVRLAGGVRLVGPDADLTRLINDKTWQYAAFADIVPVVEHRVCSGREAMCRAAGDMLEYCAEGVFVSMAYSAGGGASMVAATVTDCAARFEEADAQYFVCRYMPHCFDPTVLGVVAGPDDVYVAGVADMAIENGTAFRGSTFPSILPANVQRSLREATERVGRRLGEMGFRGIFGCDYIVDERGEYYFIEVNPRKQGTTMEFCAYLEQHLPPGAPNLPELEYHAVLHGRFPPKTVRPGEAGTRSAPLWWGTYNYKTDVEVTTHDAAPQIMSERELFASVAEHGGRGHIVREHVGAGMMVLPGTFLARVVAAAPTRDAMLEELEAGKARIAQTVAVDGGCGCVA